MAEQTTDGTENEAKLLEKALEIVKEAEIDNPRVKSHLALYSACMVVAHNDATEATEIFKRISDAGSWAYLPRT